MRTAALIPLERLELEETPSPLTEKPSLELEEVTVADAKAEVESASLRFFCRAALSDSLVCNEDALEVSLPMSVICVLTSKPAERRLVAL